MFILYLVLITFLTKGFPFVKSTAPTKEQAILRGRQRFEGFDNANEYEYEIKTGHKKYDAEKFKRQEGCLCLDHFFDPHCGSDLKTYDNGCYFLCAQKRTPDLTLLQWGSCDSKKTEDRSSNSVEMDYDFDYDETG